MVNVALHDADNTKYPNLVLMKLAAHHRARGDSVEWYSPLFSQYDKMYSSKVFSWTPDNQYLPGDVVRGGTGYNQFADLPDAIEHACPDYSLYGIDYSLGFLTRGCHKKCKWCIVPRKEGGIREHADITEFLRHREVVLMDNNVLASDHGIRQIDKMAGLDVKVDFNQGLEAGLIDKTIASKLARLKWRRCIRIACDNQAAKKPAGAAVKHLRGAGYRGEIFCYVLVQGIPDALNRVEFLRGLGVDPFAQPFRDEHNTPPTREQRQFARWVNHKAIFKTVKWAEYSAYY